MFVLDLFFLDSDVLRSSSNNDGDGNGKGNGNGNENFKKAILGLIRKQKFCACSTLFCTFCCHHYRTTT